MLLCGNFSKSNDAVPLRPFPVMHISLVITVSCVLAGLYLYRPVRKHVRPSLLGALRIFAYAWGYVFVAILWPWIFLLNWLFPLKPQRNGTDRGLQLPRYTENDLRIPPQATETADRPGKPGYWSISLPYPEELDIPPYRVARPHVVDDIGDESFLGKEEGRRTLYGSKPSSGQDENGVSTAPIVPCKLGKANAEREHQVLSTKPIPKQAPQESAPGGTIRFKDTV
jgi:hypothetical protein